jgi:hypothetical protein
MSPATLLAAAFQSETPKDHLFASSAATRIGIRSISRWPISRKLLLP